MRWPLLALLLLGGVDHGTTYLLPASVGRGCARLPATGRLRSNGGGSLLPTTRGGAPGLRCTSGAGGGKDVETTAGGAVADLPDPATYEFADSVKGMLEGMFGGGTAGFWGKRFYADEVKFEDPLVRVSGLESFQKIHAMLNDSAILTDSNMQIHDVVAAGKGRVRARFTLSQTVCLLPWRPRVAFTGVSTLWIDSNGLVTKHVDEWDSVDNQAAISLDALRDIMGPCGVWKPSATPLDTPEITLLRRDKDYMIKKIGPYKSAEVYFDKFTKKAAIEALNGYLNGGNVAGVMLEETTPMMICYEDETGRGPKYVSNFMPREYRNGPKQPPMPTDRQTVAVSSRQGGTFAVASLATELDPLEGGWVSIESVFEAKNNLRGVMLRDGMTAGEGWRLVRYQDVYGKGGNMYELWIPIESFQLRAAPLISAAEQGIKLPNIKLDFKSLDPPKEDDQEPGGGVGE